MNDEGYGKLLADEQLIRDQVQAILIATLNTPISEEFSPVKKAWSVSKYYEVIDTSLSNTLNMEYMKKRGE